MLIRLARHGQSRSNIGQVVPVEPGDHRVALTDEGHAQTQRVGGDLGRDALTESLVYDDEAQQALRAVHGWFYDRNPGGESPADCFDRTSGFIDSMLRQTERKASIRWSSSRAARRCDAS